MFRASTSLSIYLLFDGLETHSNLQRFCVCIYCMFGDRHVCVKASSFKECKDVVVQVQ